MVIGDHRRPAHGELPEADGRRHLDIGSRDARPDRIKLLEPREQVTTRRPAPRQPLVQVMMGVHQPGGDDAPVTVDHLVTTSGLDRANLGDDAVLKGHLPRPACPPQYLACDHALSYRARRRAVN